MFLKSKTDHATSSLKTFQLFPFAEQKILSMTLKSFSLQHQLAILVVLSLIYTAPNTAVLSHFWETSCCCFSLAWLPHFHSCRDMLKFHLLSKTYFSLVKLLPDTLFSLILLIYNSLLLILKVLVDVSYYIYLSSITYLLCIYFNQNSIKKKDNALFIYTAYNIYGQLVPNSSF